MFICLTLNHGEGPRGWHLVKHTHLPQAICTPGLMVMLSRDPKISSAIVVPGSEGRQLQRVPHEQAIKRANMIMRCYRPIIFQEDLLRLMGLLEPNAENTPNTTTESTKHLMGENDPFNGDDPFWHDYRSEGGSSAA